MTDETIAVVGASLAGLTAAETLREHGHRGEIVVIGDEPHEPYDRPPLSKGVATGAVPDARTALPRPATRKAEVTWRLGTAATGLDLQSRRVRLADGGDVGFDRVLVATGRRSRPWAHPDEAAWDGVLTLRGRDEATEIAARLAARPARVLVIGAGFTGCELAASCRALDLPVTLVQRSSSPLAGSLGTVLGDRVAVLHRERGVDLRCGVTVDHLRGTDGKVTGAVLSDGDEIAADLVVVALGSVPNTEWLAGSGLVADARGVQCDSTCRAHLGDGIVCDDVFVAGDVARFPDPLDVGRFVALEHWGNAVEMARIAAINMVSPRATWQHHQPLPSFWSTQFDVNIKSVGTPTAGDRLVVTQGSLVAGRFVAAYGRAGRIVGAVSFDEGRALSAYERLIAENAPLPDGIRVTEQPDVRGALSPGFPEAAPPRPAPAGRDAEDREYTPAGAGTHT